MSGVEELVKTAERLSKLIKTVSFITWFVALGAVALNMIYLNNWWNRIVIISVPVPNRLIFVVGVSLVLTIIGIQSVFIYTLYRIKSRKAAVNRKKKYLESNHEG